MLQRVLRGNEKPNLTRQKGMVGQRDRQECRPGARWLVALANHFVLLSRRYLICEMGSLNLDALGGCESRTTQNGFRGFCEEPLSKGKCIRLCSQNLP